MINFMKKISCFDGVTHKNDKFVSWNTLDFVKIIKLHFLLKYIGIFLNLTYNFFLPDNFFFNVTNVFAG